MERESGASYRRTTQQRYRLIGEVCPHCETKIFPPRDICPDCGQQAGLPFEFSGRGEVYSFTKVSRDHAPADFQDQTPYYPAWVRLDEGPLISARLTDLGDQEPEIGMLVEMVTRKLKSEGDRGIIIYGYNFRPPIRPFNGKGQPELQPENSSGGTLPEAG